MKIRLLLKSQANQVLEAIKTAGCDPTEFEWQDTQGHSSAMTISQLVHKPSGYHFSFDNHDQFHSKWSPGEQQLVDSNWTDSWNRQLFWFREWLTYLEREKESPDLWAEISNGVNVLESAASEPSNAPFNTEEKIYILAGLNEIKQHLLTAHRLDPTLVEAQLNYLVESSERLGRKDFLNVLISVLVGIVTSAALPPEATRQLFHFVGTVLRNIFHLSRLLPS